MNPIDLRPAKPDTLPLTLSVSEAAELLGVSRDLVYELVAQRELPALRLGRRIVLPRRALEELVNGAGKSEHESGAGGEVSSRNIVSASPLSARLRESSN